MKLVGVTQRLVADKHSGEIRDALDISWARLFKSLGYLPVILPTGCDSKEYFRKFKFHAVILTGGNDLSLFSKDALSGKRDTFEKKLISLAVASDVPIMGICRGMQIIANYFGARFKKVSGHVRTTHRIYSCNNSRFAKIIDEIKYVNSFHDYAVDEVSDDLVIAAVSKNGVIEAMELPRYRIWGQMWHPERKGPSKRKEFELIERFLKR